MTYTLFIDESGDFEDFDRRRGWVVAGVLVPGKRGAAERRLGDALAPVARAEGLHQPSRVHLTDRREEWGDHGRVGAFAERVLRAAAGEGGRFAAVVNGAEVRMSEPERTYRLMVLDLLALVDAMAPENLDRLDLVIAQRKERGADERMSSKADLLSDVVDALQDSVEVGLAARGLLDRLDAEPFVVWKARDSWALGVADAVANLTYQRGYPESGGVLDRLAEDGLYRSFEAFGDYATRRARVAERDGDLASAAARWASLPATASRDESLDRVWSRALGRGATGPMATLDAAIELLWRVVGGTERGAVLDAIEASLGRVGAPAGMVYRVRDMRQMLANRSGDVAEAQRLEVEQEREDAAVASDPATLPLVLKSLFHRMTTAELAMDSEHVLIAAQVQADVVDQYEGVVALLREEMGVAESADRGAPRLWVKARTSLVRGLVLSGTPDDLERASGELDALLAAPLAGGDRLRASCYRVWRDVRAGAYERALSGAVVLTETEWDVPDEEAVFALATAARAAADAVVLGGGEHEAVARAVLDAVRPRAVEGGGYPYDLLWRDLGTLEATVGRGKGAATRGFVLARSALQSQAESPVTAWKAYGITLGEAAVRAPEASPPSAPAGMGVEGETAREAAAAYRMSSPY